MKHLFVFASLLMVLVFAAPCFAGHIQVKCEPGIEIFLDGELKGVSSSDIGGLILQDVLPGSHRLRAVKAGFTPREETVTISGSEVKVWNIEKFVPQVRVSQEGQAVQAKIEQKTGILVLQTLPVEAKIEIPSLGVNETKNQDTWKVESVPEGEYDVRVSGMGKSLSYRVRIATSGTSKLFFNFITGKVEDQVLAERRSWAKKLGVMETGGDGRFIAFNNGTVLDTKSGLMWAAKDNGKMINWQDAKKYCEAYKGGGYTDWRMPKQGDLAGLYDPNKTQANEDERKPGESPLHLTELIDLTSFVYWAIEENGSRAATFIFTGGFKRWDPKSDYGFCRALPVRSVK